VQEGYVSAEAARSDYGVVTTAGGILDERATQILRREMRRGEAEGDNFEVIAG
jgi:hypothetical protein